MGREWSSFLNSAVQYYKTGLIPSVRTGLDDGEEGYKNILDDWVLVMKELIFEKQLTF